MLGSQNTAGSFFKSLHIFTAISIIPLPLAALQSTLPIRHVQACLLLSPSLLLLHRSSSFQVTNPFQSYLIAECCRHYPFFPCPTLLSSYALPSDPTHLKLPLATLCLRTLFPAPFLPEVLFWGRDIHLAFVMPGQANTFLWLCYLLACAINEWCSPLVVGRQKE